VAEPSFAEERETSVPAASQEHEKSEAASPGAAPVTSPGQFATNKAKDTRVRAQKAKKSGQSLVAERLEKAAATWEKVARHQEAAAKLEADAARIERKTLDIKSQARRAHSLVEQTETRRSRALARLRELGLTDLPATTNAPESSRTEDVKPAETSKAGAK
jgi:hypothetical protein